jgi:hypothetical protein
MTNRANNIKTAARKVRDDAIHTAGAVWDSTRDAVNTARSTAGDLINRTREAADVVVGTTRRTIQNAKIRGRAFEESARGMAAKAADRVEKVSHDFKKSQAIKARSARGKKAAVVKAQRAVEKLEAKIEKRASRTSSSRKKTLKRA